MFWFSRAHSTKIFFPLWKNSFHRRFEWNFTLTVWRRARQEGSRNFISPLASEKKLNLVEFRAKFAMKSAPKCAPSDAASHESRQSPPTNRDLVKIWAKICQKKKCKRKFFSKRERERGALKGFSPFSLSLSRRVEKSEIFTLGISSLFLFLYFGEVKKKKKSKIQMKNRNKKWNCQWARLSLSLVTLPRRRWLKIDCRWSKIKWQKLIVAREN